MWKRKNKDPAGDQWTRAIDHAVKRALRVPKAVLAIAVVAVLAGGWSTWESHEAVTQLRQESIASCESGNTFHAGQTDIWVKNYALQAGESKATASLLKELISTLAGNDPSKIAQINSILAKSGKASAAETQEFLNYIKSVDVSRNCQQAYSNAVNSPGVPSQPQGKDEAAYSETVHLQSWNGGCLSVTSTSVGSRVDEVACGSDHAWTYVPSTGELYPQGHSTVAVGDSGGNFVLKAAPGTDVHTNSIKSGPDGYNYDQINFNVSGTYWHASGDGKNVTFDNTSGDDANYWAFLSNSSDSSGLV